MARTLPAAAAVEAAKTSGAAFLRLLEVQFPGGTEWFAAEALTSPVTAAGRVVSFGDRHVEAQPGKAASHGTLTIELADPDLSFLAKLNTKPGVQNVPCFVHLHFLGTTWPDDRVTEFGGILTTPLEWDDGQALWRITLRGFEHQSDHDVGVLLTRQDFPEVACAEIEGEIIPIVYGRPVYRVPAAVVDRPGAAALASPLRVVPDTTLTINQTAGEGHFTTGETITLVVGWPGRWEAITGSFADDEATEFSISSRGAVQASGNISHFAEAGRVWVTIPDNAFPDGSSSPPLTAASRGGFPVFIRLNDNSWVTTLITHWQPQGANRVVLPLGQLDADIGNPFRVSAVPYVVFWDRGTPVFELGEWKYIVNFLPSEEIERVEARARVNVPEGDSHEQWMTFDDEHWSANLNDQSFNEALGRGGSDPGVTTLTLTHSPQQLGFEDETVWVTLKATSGNKTGGGTALSNPAEIIRDILEDDRLGSLASARINGASFEAASAALSTQFAFALLDRRKLHDLATDLAHQAQCVLFWDQGQAYLRKIVNTLSAGDSQLTVTASNYARGTLRLEEVSVKDLTTQMIGRFRQAVSSHDVRLVRTSADAVDEYGLERDELDLWAHQYPTSAALVTEFWLLYRLRTQRLVSFDTYLMGMHLQPGDTITLNISHAGQSVLSNVLARVRSVRQVAASAAQQRMERLSIVAEVNLFDWDIETDEPEDEECDTHRRTAGRGALAGGGRKSYVRSQGINSLHVLSAPQTALEGGGAYLHAPLSEPGHDPDAGVLGPSIAGFSQPPEPLDFGAGTGGGRVRGTLNAELTNTGTASVTVTEWSGSAWVNGDTISGVRTGLPIDDPIPSGTVVWLDEQEGDWFVTAAECEE